MDSLPDEIIVKIFNYLPQYKLVQMHDVCLRFQDILTSNSQLMKNVLVLISHLKCLPKVREDAVRYLSVHDTVPEQQLRKFTGVRKLVLNNATKGKLCKLLNMMDELTSVELNGSRAPPSKDAFVKEKSLDYVKLEYHHADFFNSKVQMKKLFISYMLSVCDPDESTANLLLSRTSLMHLQMTGFHLSALYNGIFKNDIGDKMKFRLQSLQMISYECHESQLMILENVAKFIKPQQDLTFVSLDGPISTSMWEALMELPLLEKLELSSKCLSKFTFSSRIIVNNNVKELIISGGISDEKFRNVLRHLPGVTKLAQKKSFITNSNHLQYVAENLPDLQSWHLRVLSEDVDFQGDFSFNHLKCLKVDAIKMFNGFSNCINAFVKQFPALERVTFRQGLPKYIIPFSVLDMLLYGLKNLQVLELGQTFLNRCVIQYIR